MGVLTMKSLVTPNLGFAVAIDSLKTLLEKPNPIPMSRWLTIGALAERVDTPSGQQPGGSGPGESSVEGAGHGVRRPSLCLSQQAVPERPYELDGHGRSWTTSRARRAWRSAPTATTSTTGFIPALASCG